MAKVAAGANARDGSAASETAAASPPAVTEGLPRSSPGRGGGQGWLRGGQNDLILLAMGAGLGAGSGSDAPCSDATTASACAQLVSEQEEECTFCKKEAEGQCVKCDSITSMEGNVRGCAQRGAALVPPHAHSFLVPGL